MTISSADDGVLCDYKRGSDGSLVGLIIENSVTASYSFSGLGVYF
jgi:hypothetical protein